MKLNSNNRITKIAVLFTLLLSIPIIIIADNLFDTYNVSTDMIIVTLSCLILLLIFIIAYHIKYRSKIHEKELQLKSAQQDLIEQRNQLSTMLNSIGDGVIAINNNRQITSINPIAIEYLGLDDEPKKYIGQDINNYLHITCTKKDCTLNKLIDAALESGTLSAFHENAVLVPLNSDKNTIYIAGNISRMVDDNNRLYGAVIIIRDITAEHQQKEELIRARNKAQESDKLKTAFLANMSHEIRTPLNGIVGFSNLLTEGEYSKEERQQFIDIINSNCHILLGLITDILDLSRIESGSLSFRMEECSLNGLIENIICTLQVNTGSDVKLIKVVPDEEIKIITDNLRLTQVLTNLINNAIKFTRKGDITIGFEITNHNENVHFFVKDTGCGMSESDLKNIFSRFYKKDEFSQGAGLGLAICEAIVEKFGGTINVTSEVGKGTTFDIILPYFRSGNYMSPDVAEANAINAKLKLKRKKVILVGEDDDSNFKLIDAVLNKKYQILRAWNGDETVEIFKRHPVDLILLDVKMPSKTGLEALKEIRRISSDIPIIMQTAYAFDADKKEAHRAGCNDFITKPIHVELLKSVVKKHLETDVSSD